MGTVDSFLCDRLGAGFATDVSTGSRTQLQRIDKPGFDSRLCEIFGVPVEVLPEIRDTAGDLGTLKHESWPVELPLRGQAPDQQAALAGAACVVPGRVKATYGTGVFVLAHVGEGVPKPAGGLLPTVAWSIDGKVEYALDGGVFAAGAMLEWLCNEMGLAEDPPALGKLAREADELGRRPGAARAGRNRRPLVASQRPRGALGHLRRHQRGQRRPRRARGNRLAGRRHRQRRSARRVDVDVLRVDGGVTNEPLMLQLQADAIGAPVEAAGADATVLGSAALAAVGSGVVSSLGELPEMLPADRKVEPERDEKWR